jgi:hypothetical protein
LVATINGYAEGVEIQRFHAHQCVAFLGPRYIVILDDVLDGWDLFGFGICQSPLTPIQIVVTRI